MFYCPKCAHQVNDEMKFCINCGEKLIHANESSGTNVKLDDSITQGYKLPLKKKKVIFYILLFLVFVFLIVSGMLFYSEKDFDNQADDNGFKLFNASFIISEYQSSTKSYDVESLKNAGYDNWYIEFSEQGTGSIYALNEEPIGFTYKDGVLYLSGGKRCSYTLNKEKLILQYSDEIKLVFKESNSPVLKPVKTPQPTPEYSVKDYIGSEWFGTISISNTKGDASDLIKDGLIDVVACLDKDDGGNTFFEVYYANDYDKDPILSMWVKVYDDCFKADIGDKDSWYFDLYLISSENKSFVFKPNNGKISHTYYYDSGSTSCKIYLQLEHYE